MTVLDVVGLGVRDADGAPLLSDVSLSVRSGGILTLVGESGSGKSLIAQALFGLLPREFSVVGGIAVGGGTHVPASDRRQLAAHWRDQLMLIPQEPSSALDPVMRVARQMSLAGMAPQTVPGALMEVDLPPQTARAFPFELSGGMAQRVLVATALGVGAPIVVADEPTKGLDPARAEQIVALLRDVAASGRALLVITHDRRVAEGLDGDLAIVRDGRIVEQGRARDVLSTPRTDTGRAWVEADPARWPRCARCCDTTALALSTHGLAFAWPGRANLFENLDLHLPHGGILAVSGPSGCGKSTLGDILLGLRKPTAGSVEWGGVDITRSISAVRSQRQLYQKLHQDPAAAFIPGVSIGSQLGVLRKVKPDLDPELALPPLLDRLKLRPDLLDRVPSAVSGGEAQRLALARLLLLDPLVIIADEPTSRLDPVVQKDTMMLLRDLVDERRLSLVLISHDAALTRAIADEQLRLG